MPDGLEHPLDLVGAPLVEDELHDRVLAPSCEHAGARRRGAAVLQLDALPQPLEVGRRPARRARPPRTPSRRRSADGRAGARGAPSFVSSSAPVVSASSRPTGTTRSGWATRPTTVGRPCGSRAVVTTPAGLCSRTWASGSGASGLPSSSTRSPVRTIVASSATCPLTPTRPARISSSAPRRDATPARRGRH